jgi:hypothetical protein
MKRLLVGGVAALACLAVLGSTTLAQQNEEKVKRALEEKALVESKVAIRIAPLPERVAMADCVAAGKLGKVEGKNVKALPIFGGKEKVDYQVLPLTVDAAIVGVKKGAKTIRVAFVPPMQDGGGGGGLRGRPIRPGGFRPLVLENGMEGCFFLTKHPVEDMYVATTMDSFINKKDNNNYDKDLKTIKHIGKMLADPMKGLKSKDATERAETATLLLYRYRGFRPGATKTEAIPADESKLILQGLADGDFTKQVNNQNEITPIMGFYQLRLTDKDGWKPGPFKNYQTEFPAAAKTWLKDNAAKYRIERFVPDKGEKDKK